MEQKPTTKSLLHPHQNLSNNHFYVHLFRTNHYIISSRCLPDYVGLTDDNSVRLGLALNKITVEQTLDILKMFRLG